MQAMTLPSLATGEQVAFKRDLVGWIVVILNTLMALNAANFFLGMLKTSVSDWLMMNTCTPVIVLFVIGFLLASPALMVAGAALMFRYGTLGLFVFSWSGGNLIAQAGHILMTLAVVYVTADVIRNRRWKALRWGLLLAIVLLIPLTIVQKMWVDANPEMAEELFSGTLTLPGQ